MKDNKKIQTIIFVFSLAVLALIIFGVWPLMDGIKKDSEDLISAKNSIVSLDSQIYEVEKFKNSFGLYEEYFKKIDQLFINPEDPVDFIKFLEDSADDCNINMQVGLPSSQIDPNVVLFQITTKGDFSNILLFVDKIEFGPYLIEIRDLSIQSIEKDENYKNSATLNIKVFTKNESEI